MANIALQLCHDGLNTFDIDPALESAISFDAIVMPSSEETLQRTSAFEVWDDVLALESGGFPLTAVSHSRIFQYVALLTHQRESQALDAEFSGLDAALSPSNVVLTIEGVAWETLVPDILMLFKEHGLVVDPLIIGSRDEHIVFVYLPDQETANRAIQDLNGATITENRNTPKETSITIGLRMATYGDIKHCLLIKGISPVV